MEEISNIMIKSNNLNTASQHQHWGEYYYDLAAGLEDDKAPQKQIDASWGLASKAFWFALTLGGQEASLFLFKCFRQGVGVEKDSYIRDLMYGAALQLTPQGANQIRTENKPKISKSMQPAIDTLVKLVKDTQKQLPKEGVDAAGLNDQLTKFNHAIKLPSGKLIQSYFTKKNIQNNSKDKELKSHILQLAKNLPINNKPSTTTTNHIPRNVNRASSRNGYSIS
ncbi:hypothetical protein [Rickettsia endosymbiont of Oedothorax gibbosus]|uniref:hypothetical protein n=1 Tax=Rickettsia endosymbiont of Oedothorax gibbosus TaxID=931099 RepID=UPI00202481CC|nr:hypothetical protein [Rickettsia endosymbiont of Oedothorax gibbosus]